MRSASHILQNNYHLPPLFSGGGASDTPVLEDNDGSQGGEKGEVAGVNNYTKEVTIQRK